jgi:enterochelin esterase-like enzyme
VPPDPAPAGPANLLGPRVRAALAAGGAAAVRELARAHRGPIIEPAAAPDAFHVTFVLADRMGTVRRVGLFCPAIPDGFAHLYPLGSATFARTFVLARGVRVRYHFCPDPPERIDDAGLRELARSPFARRIDYLNPLVDQVHIRGLRTRILHSLLVLPGALPAPPDPGPPATRGRCDQVAIDSGALRRQVRVVVHRPSGTPATDRPHPTVVLLEANDEWRGPEIFDRIAASGRVRPFLGILVRRAEHFSTNLRDLGDVEALGRFVADELLAPLAARGEVGGDHTVAGFSAAAAAAVALSTRAPDLFPRLLAISPALHLTSRMDVLRTADGSEVAPFYLGLATAPRRVYLAAGRYEDTAAARIHTLTAGLAGRLRRRGAEVRFDAGPTDHDSVSAGAYLHAGLIWLLGPSVPATTP